MWYRGEEDERCVIGDWWDDVEFGRDGSALVEQRRRPQPRFRRHFDEVRLVRDGTPVERVHPHARLLNGRQRGDVEAGHRRLRYAAVLDAVGRRQVDVAHQRVQVPAVKVNGQHRVPAQRRVHVERSVHPPVRRSTKFLFVHLHWHQPKIKSNQSVTVFTHRWRCYTKTANRSSISFQVLWCKYLSLISHSNVN